MPAVCPHFGACGGCQKQDQPYADQLAYKQTYITNLLAQFHPQEIRDIVASPQIWHFRNKMEFAVSGTAGAPRVGLRPQQKFNSVIDIRECRVFYPQAGTVLDAVRAWIMEGRVEPYDLRRRTGCLRYVCMRHSKAYDEVMVTLVVAMSRPEFEREREMFGPVIKSLSSLERIASVHACLNTGASDEAASGEMVLLYGKPRIRERINGIDYQIGPRSFFQTNPYCCERLYEIIRARAGGCNGPVLDLFCGCGGISLQVAAAGNRVTGIDIAGQNIDDARENCGVHGIARADFVCQDAQVFLSQAATEGRLREYYCLIVDPPRQGLTKKDRKLIVESGIGQMIYVSCNPWNLVQDLKTLLEAYSVAVVEPVDMFPHTQHTETVVYLKRQ